jgi:hypothetical protein
MLVDQALRMRGRTVIPDSSTLLEARTWLRERALKDGARCPCCNQLAKVYKRPIHSAMARALIQLYNAAPEGDWVYLPEIGGRGGDASKLRYWGLIQEEQTLRPDGGRAGYWRVTRRGGQFVRGEITVPKYAHVYDGRCLGTTGDPVTVQDALGKRFNYAELMA